MNDAEVISVMWQHLEGKSPKECSTCGRTYTNLKDYLLHTTHIGRPISYDAEMGVFQPSEPLGTMSLANCSCGNTISISSDGMTQMTMWRLLSWLRGEMTRRRQEAPVILEDLRRDIDFATLAELPAPQVDSN